MIVPGVAAANLLILPDHAARLGSLRTVRRS
jgi:hypothetical protein